MLLRLVVAAVIAAAAMPGTAHCAPYVERPDDQMLILRVALGQTTLHDGLVTYAEGGRLYVPLLELCSALAIPVTGTVEDGLAAGWFREESWRFVLDADRRLLSLNGREQDIDWAAIERHATDIYVPSDWFEAWFSLDLGVQLDRSQLYLPTGQQLPLEHKIARSQRWASMRRMQPPTLRDVPMSRAEAGWLSWPAVDATVSATMTASPDDNRRNAGVASRLDLLAAGDLLRANGLLSINVHDNPVSGLTTDTRLRLQKPALEADEIAWSAGDIVSPVQPLLSTRIEGVGVRLGTIDDAQATGLSRTMLRGEALNGWDVELYRNNELLAFVTVEASNQYRFDDIPLQPGLNLFRIVLYGPQGQRRERAERIIVGDDMLTKGEQRWQTYALVPQRRLLPKPWNNHDNDDGSPGNDGRRMSTADRLMAGIAYQRALTTRWTVGLDALTARLNDNDRHHYLAAKTQAGFGNVLMEGQWLRDSTGGHAARFAARSIGIANNGGIEYERYRDYSSPEINDIDGGDVLMHRLRMRWDNRSVERLPVSFEYEQQRFRDAASNTIRESHNGRLRLSRRWSSLTTSSVIELRRDSGKPTIADSGMLLSYRRPKFDLTGQWSYRLAPESALRTGNLTANWALGERLRLRANFNRSFEPFSKSRADLGMVWATSHWTSNLGISYDNDGRYQLNVSFFTSLQRSDQGWRADARSGTSTSSVMAHVFLDHDGNGRYDEGDEPLPDVRVSAGVGGQSPATDAGGHALLSQLPANQPTLVRLREETLDNPYWIPVSPTRQILAPPGKTLALSFPVMLSTEVDGTVFFLVHGKRKPAANVSLQLLNASGQVIREQSSAFDGGYLFDTLPPGAYRLRVSPEQLSRLSLQTPGPRTFALGGCAGDVVTLDWELVPVAPSSGDALESSAP